MIKICLGKNMHLKKQFCLWESSVYNYGSGYRTDGSIHYVTGDLYYFDGERRSREVIAGINKLSKSNCNLKDII
jgi:hypothetical protein